MTVQDLLSTLDGEVVATIREDDTDLISIRAAGWDNLDETMKKKEVKKWRLKNFAHIVVKLFPGGGSKDLDGDGVDDTIATANDVDEVIDDLFGGDADNDGIPDNQPEIPEDGEEIGDLS